MIIRSPFDIFISKKSQPRQVVLISSVLVLVNVLLTCTTASASSGQGYQVPNMDINSEIEKWQNRPVFDPMKILDEIERLEKMRLENVKYLDEYERDRREQEEKYQKEQEQLKREEELLEKHREERRLKRAENSKTMAIIFFAMCGIVITLIVVFSIAKWLDPEPLPELTDLVEDDPMILPDELGDPNEVGEGETLKNTVVTFNEPNTTTSVSQTLALHIDGNTNPNVIESLSPPDEDPIPGTPTSFIYQCPNHSYSLGVLFPIPEGKSQESIASDFFDLPQIEPIKFETMNVPGTGESSSEQQPSLGSSKPKKKIPGPSWD